MISIFLILFLSAFLFNAYSSYSASKVNAVAKQTFKKEIYSELLKNLNDSLVDNDIENILKIYKNKDDEILYVDYDLNKTYKLLNNLTKRLQKTTNKLSKGIKYTFPFFVGSKNIFLSNIGPQITVYIKSMNSLLTNINTKITNYGLNNALVEAYIKITIEGKVISPVSEEVTTIEYDFLIASKVINGRVPEIHGNYLTSNSSLFDVPIE